MPRVMGMKTLIAVILTTLIISGVAWGARGVWQTGSSILDYSDEVRMAYAAGAYDAYSSIRTLSEKRPGTETIIVGLIKSRMACMDDRGDSMREFGTWASSIWRSNMSYNKDNAASLLLASACDR